MANTQSNNKLTFALSYGFVEGSAHGRKISKMLKKNGLEPARNLATADIIIAHSAGCWLLPDNARPKLTLYIGMPLPLTSAQKTWLKTNWLSVKLLIANGNVLGMLRGALLNTYYALRHPRRSIYIIKGIKTAVPTIYPGSTTIFIANRNDPWPHSDRLFDYINNEDWAFMSLPGLHDNLWHHPTFYVDIIKKYAELLEKTDR